MITFKFVRKIIILFIILQFIAFVFVKQRFSELDRKNTKLENEIYVKSGRFLTQIEPKIITKEKNRIELNKTNMLAVELNRGRPN